MIDKLYSIVVLELFLGGGGRLTAAGHVTLRMVLFAAFLYVGALTILLRREQTRHLRLAYMMVLLYLLVHVPAIIGAALHGVDTRDMMTELQQSLYWLAAPVFALVLRSRPMVQRTATLVQVAGIVLAVGYVAVIVGITAGLIDAKALFLALLDSEEISARGDSFLFYKGFLYLGIALVFLVSLRPRLWVLLAIGIASALVLTLTRGFILSTSGALLLLLFAQRRRWAAGLALAGIVVAAFLVWSYLPSSDEGLLSAREESNSQRLDDMTYIANHASALTLLVGEGFGVPINGRANIENTYLWVLWKLGIAGLVFWLLPLALCTWYFLQIPRRGSNRLACAYFFSAVLIYIQTGTNPYLNNPIGLSFIIMAMFSLQALALESRPESLLGYAGAIPMPAASGI